MNTPSSFDRLKELIIGKSRDLSDQNLFHKVSLIAVFAWVGLGADGLSSACYGPEETFKALQAHPALSVFVGLASALTILIICASYSQIIELFPAGGGGYLVASKLLSPTAGVVSGSALLIDYVLTIAISIASGADALFSLLPESAHTYKLAVALAGVIVLTLINLRGVRESVLLLAPVFFLFLATHAFGIGYAVLTHASGFPAVMQETVTGVRAAHHELGMMGMLLLLLRAYSMGAGTYTGIEAVSNGLPILREPRVETGKRTMRYLGISLALTATGLLLAYLLFHVTPQAGKTLNAVLFEAMTHDWPGQTGFVFVLVTLASEAALLFIAAQAGFLDGPRVLANMALDRWFPARFATLSDRFVTQNGILLMSGAALLVMYFTRGAVELLLVLYSINVFITFSLSQLGMVRHWWRNRATVRGWRRKLAINGVGLGLTAFILVSLTLVKFFEGGWITLLITAAVVGLAFLIRRHYQRIAGDLRRLDGLLGEATEAAARTLVPLTDYTAGAPTKTAVVLVNGFNGLGLHTLLGVVRMFPGVFRHFVFVQVGVVDAGNFKGAAELQNLTQHTRAEADRYVAYARQHGFRAEGLTAVGTDLIDEVRDLASGVLKRYPQAVFFGGQLVFREESWVTRWLHNYSVFALQRQFYRLGFPFLILPVRV
jgi:amino acid transporter